MVTDPTPPPVPHCDRPLPHDRHGWWTPADPKGEWAGVVYVCNGQGQTVEMLPPADGRD